MANATRMTRTQWSFLILLLISICINYVDRGSLGVAGKMLESELHLDHVMFGKLGSAFFWTYAAFQIVAGWLVDRYNVNWVYGLGYLLWSVAMLLTGYVEGIAMLFGLRLLLGIGESVAYPAYSRIISRGIQPEHRGGDRGEPLECLHKLRLDDAMLDHVGRTHGAQGDNEGDDHRKRQQQGPVCRMRRRIGEPLDVRCYAGVHSAAIERQPR